jgi:hypothetical protein
VLFGTVSHGGSLPSLKLVNDITYFPKLVSDPSHQQPQFEAVCRVAQNVDVITIKVCQFLGSNLSTAQLGVIARNSRDAGANITKCRVSEFMPSCFGTKERSKVSRISSRSENVDARGRVSMVIS